MAGPGEWTIRAQRRKLALARGGYTHLPHEAARPFPEDGLGIGRAEDLQQRVPLAQLGYDDDSAGLFKDPEDLEDVPMLALLEQFGLGIVLPPRVLQPLQRDRLWIRPPPLSQAAAVDDGARPPPELLPPGHAVARDGVNAIGVRAAAVQAQVQLNLPGGELAGFAAWAARHRRAGGGRRLSESNERARSLAAAKLLAGLMHA